MTDQDFGQELEDIKEQLDAFDIQDAPSDPPPKKIKKLLGKIVYFGLLAVFVSVFVYCAIYICLLYTSPSPRD